MFLHVVSKRLFAAQHTFVIMSEVLGSLLIMTKCILCMCSPQLMGG